MPLLKYTGLEVVGSSIFYLNLTCIKQLLTITPEKTFSDFYKDD